jgi:hypothetical protein
LLQPTDYAIPGMDGVVAQVNNIFWSNAASVITLTGKVFSVNPYSVLASFQSASENLDGDLEQFLRLHLQELLL